MVRQKDYECQPQDSGSEHSLPHYCESDYHETDYESDPDYQSDPLFIARMPNMESSRSIRSMKIPFSYGEKICEYLSQITERQQIKFLWGTVIVLLILLGWSFMRGPVNSPSADLTHADSGFCPENHEKVFFENGHVRPSEEEEAYMLGRSSTSIFEMEEENDSLVLPTTSIEITESASNELQEEVRTASNQSVWNRETPNDITTWNNTPPSNANAYNNNFAAQNAGVSPMAMDDGVDFSALSQEQWNTNTAYMAPISSDQTAFQATGPSPQFTVNPQEGGRYPQNNVQNPQHNVPMYGGPVNHGPINNGAAASPNAGGYSPSYNQVPQHNPYGSYNAVPNTGAHLASQQPYESQAMRSGAIANNTIANNASANGVPVYNQRINTQGANTNPYNMVNFREEIPANPTNNTYRNAGTSYGAVQNGPYAADTTNPGYNQIEQQRLAANMNADTRFDGSHSVNHVGTQQTYQQQLNQQQYGNHPSYSNPSGTNSQYNNSQSYSY